MRGGFRPGAGRKVGSKDSVPRKVKKTKRGKRVKKEKPEDQAFTLKARKLANFYRETRLKASRGEKPSKEDRETMTRLLAELDRELDPEEKVLKSGSPETLEPLAYMLQVMNDPDISKERRDRMAIAAAPFVHDRKGEGFGKKEEREDRAKKAGAGRFAAGRPPIALVK